MELTAKNVKDIILDCLPDKKLTDKTERAKLISAKGVIAEYLFMPDKLKEHEVDILDMLHQLPNEFQRSIGGWSFLNACLTKDDTQWGEHGDIEGLMCLGLAIEAVEYCLPREMWKLFPGNVPYFVVTK